MSGLYSDEDVFGTAPTQGSAAPGLMSDQDVFGSPTQLQASVQATQPRTWWQRFKHGAGDTLLGTEELAIRALGTPSEDPYSGMPQNYTPQDQAASATGVSNEISARETAYQANRVRNNQSGIDVPRLLGAAAAAAPVMALMPDLGPGVGAGIAGGAMQGAAAALMQPVGNTPDGYWSAKGSQVATGAGLGGVFGGVLGWFGGKADDTAASSADKYRDAVNFLRDRDVVPTIGQNIGPRAATVEDATSTLNLAVPGGQRTALETFNKAALNEALAPLNMQYTGPAGRDGLKAVSDVLDKGYEAIKPQLSMPVSDELRTNIGQIVSDASTPDPSIATTVNRILDKALYSQVDDNNFLSGTAFKNAESMLGKYSQRYSGDNATATENGIGDALESVQGALRDSLADANPAVADKLAALNRGYAILARVQKAVPTGDADGIFTPFQLAKAVRQGDSTVRDRAYTQGDALLQNMSDAGLRVLGNKFPNSGTATRGLMADPLAWPFQAGATLLGKPLYSQTGAKLAGAAINGMSRVPSLVQPVAKALRPTLPYLMPSLTSAVSE